jgi:protein ImuB
MAFASIHVSDFSIQAVVRAELVIHERAICERAIGQRAIALVEGSPPQERVVAINEAAARAGINPGMTKSQAAQFHSVEIRLRSHIAEQSAHAALLDIGWSISPRVEDTAIDSIVVDLDGLGSLFGSEEAMARLLARHATDLGLAVHVAVSANLEVALHAARGLSGITVIPPGEEARRMGALPLEVFSPSAEMMETLERWGVRTCEALAKLPVLELSERLGQQGVQLHQWARGQSRRVLILAEAKLCFEEEMALEYAVEELEPLAFLLGRLLDQSCARLAARSLSACAIRLRFELDAACRDESMLDEGAHKRTGPDEIAHKRSGLDESARKRSGGNKSYEKLFTLPVPMRDSKMLLKLLRLHLQSDPPSAPIVHIFLAADPAAPRAMQHGLFVPSSPDPEQLELTLARLANLVGHSRVGSPRIPDSHRPDAFEMSRFFPARDAPEMREKTDSQGERAALAAFRAFRPAPRAAVALRDGCPAHISFSDMHGEVTAASGPWRTSGEWWREDGWSREEWEIEIRPASDRNAAAIGPSSSIEPRREIYRIYYDTLCRSWFVAGMYD